MKQALSKDPKLQDWATVWLETYIRPVAAPSGYEHYRDNLSKHILPALGSLKLSQLSVPVVQNFLNETSAHGNLRTGGPLSAKSIKNMRIVLNCCCTRAVADGWMAKNPIPMTVYPRCRTPKVDIMSDSDQSCLEQWLFQDDALENAGILVGLYTGLRLGEVCALRWKNYDFETGVLNILETVRRVSTYRPDAPYGAKTQLVFTPCKTESSQRTLYLPPILQDYLAWHYQRYEALFGQAPNQESSIIYTCVDGLMDPDNLSHYFGDILSGLGLPHVKYHALRHTFATRAIENGVDVATVSGLLGHADVTTTTHYYVHPRQAAMRKAMTAVAPVCGNTLHRNAPRPAFVPQKAAVPVVHKRVCRRRTPETVCLSPDAT